ncbi:MAG: hypothetical protein WBA93_23590 [Microcoleaceae cyanobacterium]
MPVEIIDEDPVDITVINKTNKPLIAKFNQVKVANTLAVETAINDLSVTVADSTGFTVGQYLILYNGDTDRYYTGYILNITGNVIYLDTPLDSVFPIGTPANGAITNMAVDGSSTTQVFGLRGIPVEKPLNETFNITRIIFNCLTATAVDLLKFADLTALTYGLVLRRRNGDYFNIFNVKSNADIEGITLDWKPFSATKPNEGQDGFSARLTFNGQEKMDVVINLIEGTDLEFLVQDDLTGITRLEVIAEGHVVDPNERS